MNWFFWTLAAWLAVGALGSVALVGKPRKPIDPGTAMLTVIVNGLLIAGVVIYGG